MTKIVLQITSRFNYNLSSEVSQYVLPCLACQIWQVSKRRWYSHRYTPFQGLVKFLLD